MQNRASISRIVLTDDDIDDQFFFQTALRQSGVEAELHVYDNGILLLEALIDEQAPLPDVIFMDYNMPCKNAVQCMEELRRHIHLQHIPVIILTTGMSPAEMEKVYQKGAAACIRKPHELSGLVKMIQDVFANELNTHAPIFNMTTG
jgi:CheY-like chemotaxis protein